MKLIVGITGGISTGKSYVSSFIESKGYKVIDTDKICHDLEEYGNSGYEKIKEEFPSCIINNSIDRKALAKIIFNDKLKRIKLNDILHPLIKNEVKNIINSSCDNIIFVDVPLMFEAHFDDLCDKIICVSTTLDTQLTRLMLRDKLEKEDALIRINAQMNLNEKEKLSDYIIYSEDDFNKTQNNIIKILERIEEDYNAKNI